MKTQPIEGQQIQVKLKDGEWQEATYREGTYVDLYGLPLAADKVLAWRPASSHTHMNGVGPADGSLPLRPSSPG
jgi:hypothetical protein